MGQMSSQRIRYLQTSDGIRLAWAEAGTGPVVVKAANWMSHLEYEWENPLWRHWIQFFSEHFRFVRYDERGCGMTDWNTADLSFTRQLDDLEAVVEAAGCREPFTMVGISQGGAPCIRYAVRHPERVSRLILYGAYAQGWARRHEPEKATEYDSISELMRVGWGRNNPVFRQVFTSRFVPEATDEQLAWFNDLCLKTASGPNAAAIFRSRAEIDVIDLLPQVTAPTLVLHARGDAAVPLTQGHMLAAGLPNAEFVELDSNNHILLEHEPAWKRFTEAVLDFMGTLGGQSRGSRVRGTVAPRTRDPGAHIRRARQRRHRRASRDQREDGAQPRVECLRQAWRVVARAGDCLCPGPRLQPAGRK